MQEDRVVGVAFQNMPGLENAGFFIPPPVIEHFLKDIEDGHYDGFPHLGLRVAALQNPAYRDLLRLPDNSQGARIDGLLPIPSVTKVLKVEDVLLRVGPFAVASDGTILYQGNRLSAALAFQLGQDGESVPVQVWREGKAVDLALPLSVYDADRAGGFQHDALPRYLVYGGLVFTPLSIDFLRTLGRNTETSYGDFYYELHYRRYEDSANARREPVVLATVLADAVNANVAVRGRAFVDRINGVRIEQLEDVARAFGANTNAFDLIEFLPHHGVECLERAEVAQANARILKTYGIANDRRL